MPRLRMAVLTAAKCVFLVLGSILLMQFNSNEENKTASLQSKSSCIHLFKLEIMNRISKRLYELDIKTSLQAISSIQLNSLSCGKDISCLKSLILGVSFNLSLLNRGSLLSLLINAIF